jgi:hypothetical protein
MATPNIKHDAIVQPIRCMDNIDDYNSNIETFKSNSKILKRNTINNFIPNKPTACNRPFVAGLKTLAIHS